MRTEIIQSGDRIEVQKALIVGPHGQIFEGERLPTTEADREAVKKSLEANRAGDENSCFDDLFNWSPVAAASVAKSAGDGADNTCLESIFPWSESYDT